MSGRHETEPTKVAFIEVDVTTDPLTWPLPPDAPSTAAEWDAEWRAYVVRTRSEPANFWTARFRLHELAVEPEMDFKRRFLAVWYLASGQAPRLGIRPAGGAYRALVTRLDELVSEERGRQIRDGIAVGAGEAVPASIPARSADRVRLCSEAVTTLHSRGQYVTVSAIHAETGIQRETISSYINKGWLTLVSD